jgi:Plavaka transposase
VELTTDANEFGMFKIFWGTKSSSHDPDRLITALDLYEGTESATDCTTSELVASEAQTDVPRDPRSKPEVVPTFYPYPNESSFNLGDWYWSRGTTKSMADFKELLKVLEHPHFKPSELREVNWSKVHSLLSQPLKTEPPPGSDSDWVDDCGDEWKATKVAIQVPFPTRGRGPIVKEFAVGVLHHRNIISSIKDRLSDPRKNPYMHYKPFKLMWNPGGRTQAIRVHGELYTSDEYLKADQEIQGLDLPSPQSQLERVVLALMFWTDATLLANFGTAKLWPCYMFYGNDSKYRRSKLSTDLCNHIAYFLNVSCCCLDFYG